LEPMGAMLSSGHIVETRLGLSITEQSSLLRNPFVFIATGTPSWGKIGRFCLNYGIYFRICDLSLLTRPKSSIQSRSNARLFLNNDKGSLFLHKQDKYS
jgi:hypothetical protein